MIADIPLVISQYEGVPSGSCYRADSCYRVPEPGEYYCLAEVTKAREYYANQDVKYLLAFDLFKADGKWLSDEEKNAEYQRLTKLGYHLYQSEYWTYKSRGEKVVRPIIVGLFTEGELTAFHANPSYGYAFRFVSNGDGSSISIEECDLVIEFENLIEFEGKIF